MSEPLSKSETEQYTAIIDKILQTADLATVTRKVVRSSLQDALDGKDLSSQKNAIKELIESRFDALTQSSESADEQPSPPKKKKTPAKTDLDADARLAAELQAQENRLASGRSTRGSAATSRSAKVVKKKATPRKKKSAATVDGAEDDPDARPKRNTGFQKPFLLSDQLATLLGESSLSRPQVVKKLWEYIKANNLQNEKDKREIICDASMQAVFKQSSVNMFAMNKAIGSHLYPVGEE